MTPSSGFRFINNIQTMSFKVKGRVTDILPVQGGSSAKGSEWKKQEFVLETLDDQFTRKICFTLFNDKIDLLKPTDKNQEVEVSFSLEGREYNGRWYHNVNAFRIDRVESRSVPEPPIPQYNEDDYIPASEGEKDDLPF